MSVEIDQLRVYLPENVSVKVLKHAEQITGRRVTESCKGRKVIQAKTVKEREYVRSLLGISRG